MDLNITLHKVKQVCQDNPSPSNLSPRSQLAANHPSLPDEYRIRLHLQTWANILAEPIQTYGQQRARVDKIFHFFIKVATLNQLANTLAVKSLSDSLDSLSRLGDCRIDIKGFDWKTRISQFATPAKAEYENESDLRKLSIHGMPLFNIWDSLSFIYTVCAENIHKQVEAELHLVQFRVIIQALRACKNIFPRDAGPKTVAATWTEESSSKPLTISFATTCVGLPRSGTKPAMAAVRKQFMKAVTVMLKKISKKIIHRQAPPNPPGNCPEFLNWSIVCQQPETENPGALRCCKHCETALDFLGVNGIEIEDLWQTSLTGTGEIVPIEPYPFRPLKSLATILSEFGGT